MPLMKTGVGGKAVIKKWEGIEDGDPRTVNLDPYLCPADYWTIGWGHVVLSGKGVMLKGAGNKAAAYAMYPGGIAMTEAETLLSADLVRYERMVYNAIGDVPTTQNQFDALVAICFNIGGTAFAGSSVAKYHKARQYTKAADSFLMWTKATVNGVKKELAGLVSRRKDERALYLKA